MRWCLGCKDWVEPIERRIELERKAGEGRERAPSHIIEACPNDDGTASGHLLVDTSPA
jgi:hypothetical protein